MAHKKLSKTIVKQLEMLPAVWKASPTYIHFAPEFKEHALKRYNEGYTGLEIFLEAGFPQEAISTEYAKDTIKRWRTTVRDKGTSALHDTKQGRRKRSKQYKHLTDQEKIAYLEAENAFLTELRATHRHQRSLR